MQALEELALSYDTKDRQFDAIHTEKVVLAEENERIQVSGRERDRQCCMRHLYRTYVRTCSHIVCIVTIHIILTKDTYMLSATLFQKLIMNN